jgi:hypothetical protein
MKPSLVDITCKLTVALVLAQQFILLHSEHEEAVTEFVSRVSQLSRKLRNSFYERKSLEQEGQDGPDCTHA